MNIQVPTPTTLKEWDQLNLDEKTALIECGWHPEMLQQHFLDRAVERVERTTAFANLHGWGGYPSKEFVVCVAALNEITWGIQAPLWQQLVNNNDFTPDQTADSALRFHAGLCGHSALAYAEILNRFGIPVRSVQFYWDTHFAARNHIAVEAHHDHHWRYYDPTWGAFYHHKGHVLSIEQARQGKGTLRQHQTLLWALISDWGNLEPLTNPNTTVLYDNHKFWPQPDDPPEQHPQQPPTNGEQGR